MNVRQWFLANKDNATREKLAKEFNIKLLGKIPFHSTIAKNCDAGTPELIHNHSDLNKIYLELSKSLINK